MNSNFIYCWLKWLEINMVGKLVEITVKWLVTKTPAVFSLHPILGYPLVNSHSSLLKMAIEIVSFPIKHDDFR